MSTKLTRQKSQPDLVKASWDSLSENTQDGYKIDLKMFNDFVKKDLSDVTPQDIIDYVGFLRTQKYKNSTINRKVASVSKLFGVYHNFGLIKINPVALAKKLSKLTFKTMRSQRSSLLIDDVRKCINMKPVNRSDRDAGIMIKFLAKTGVRISEMLNIELKDIDDVNSEICRIRILGKGKKERFITIEKEFIKEVQGVFNHKELLFCTSKGEKYNRRYVWRLVKERFRRAVGIHVHPHMLRHFFITYKIVVEKMDIKAVSKYAGHSDVGVTLNMYVDNALDIDGARMDI